jgi:hypothetical protein
MTVEERSSKRDFLKKCLLCGAGIAVGARMSPASNAMTNLDFDQKHSKEAMYYTKSGDKMLCDLCPNECIVLPGKAGIAEHGRITMQSLYLLLMEILVLCIAIL